MNKKQGKKSQLKRRKASIKRNNERQKKTKHPEMPKLMIVNFFQTECQEPPISTSNFGVCDNQDGQKAYTDSTDATKWIANVENPNTLSITFTAIDNCIPILRGDGNDEKRCDGMLTYTDNIVFIELKEVAKSWISDAIEQLEITVQHFIANHDISAYKHKRAFACNKKHPQFQVIDTETKRRFFDRYRIRLNLQHTIKV